MNSVTLVGRAVADPEIKNFNSGSKVAEIRIAVDAGKDKDTNQRKSDFFQIKIWNKGAEIAEKHLKKGHRFGVTGELTTEHWESNGNKRSKVVIKANRITLLQDKSGASEGEAPKQAEEDDIFNAFAGDDEIPF